ncbi:MAG TPA: Sir2 family NAD-dependent protein deacetylase [Geobacteraceae bacterium]
MNRLAGMAAEECAGLIRSARAMAVLTGAGISTAAGIPDFRGPRGLYVTRRYDPEKVFDIDWFDRAPRYFYEFSRDFVGVMKETKPTFTHCFLAWLEQQGHLKGVITQNIDALHSEAGSRQVIELHGSYRSAHCRSCGRRQEGLSYEWWDMMMEKSPEPPIALCPRCKGVLKPDIVFFGEPVHAITEAQRMVTECDLLLVLGSSLQVTPASLLPLCTTRTTIVVNRGPVTLAAAPYRYFVNEELDLFCRAVAKYLGMTD